MKLSHYLTTKLGSDDAPPKAEFSSMRSLKSQAS
jgi:hypothetical protein